MKARSYTILAFALVALANAFPVSLQAQNVTARISTREAYIGMPVVLQIQIENAKDFEMPEIPEIDGCNVKAAGTPSQSSRITIVNGRRSESRSVTMQYLITPRRAGKFKIPALEIEVDGEIVRTQPLKFVATKSETGDLMFVKVEGSKQKVYVGEQLELNLKVWLKPFVDREKQVKLSESNMWQMISDQTSWGSFSDRMQEMAENNRRPAGNEVLRDDGSGNERSYYLYEVDATVYPTRPGKIDARDLQIVVNYPTALGKSRDPFESFFGGSSPFGRSRSLTVESARPIVAEASIDSTEVIPIPTDGRPADYRGAVGRYRIIAEAEPSSVDAGDPITLRIGILGDGPMDLVQAPPLADITSLTNDFKTADQSLAGFVQNDSKVFVTTIRPRRHGLSEIPAIPFSFFDPESESFETAYSQPIPITVNEAETLSLGSIVGKSRGSSRETDSTAETATLTSSNPDLTNDFSSGLLTTQTPATSTWWWYFVIVPPIVWATIAFAKTTVLLLNQLPRMGSARTICLSELEKASSSSEMVETFIRYIAMRTKQDCQSTSQAVGGLRSHRPGGNDLRPIANEVESWFSRLQRSPIGNTNSVEVQRAAARSLLEKIESQMNRVSGRRVRRAQRVGRKMATGLLIMVCVPASGLAANNNKSQSSVPLTRSQQESILAEANELYKKAQEIAADDKAESRQLFLDSANKYLLLVDSGLSNSGLHLNLGNAQLQSDQQGRAIANYLRSLRLDSANGAAKTNLQFARNKLNQGTDPNSETATTGSTNLWKPAVEFTSSVNTQLIQLVGNHAIQFIFAAASVFFWGLLIARSTRFRFRMFPVLILPMLPMLACGLSLFLDQNYRGQTQGILIVNEVELREGDGSEFQTMYKLESAEGREVKVVSARGEWVKVATEGLAGWIPQTAIEQL